MLGRFLSPVFISGLEGLKNTIYFICIPIHSTQSWATLMSFPNPAYLLASCLAIVVASGCNSRHDVTESASLNNNAVSHFADAVSQSNGSDTAEPAVTKSFESNEAPSVAPETVAEDTLDLNENKSADFNEPESNESVLSSFSPAGSLTHSELEPSSPVSFTGADVFVNTMRQWKDDSDTFSAKAELIEVHMKERRVKLLKDNGVSVLVAFERLSDHDKNYVREFIEFHRQQEVQTNASKLVDVLVD